MSYLTIQSAVVSLSTARFNTKSFELSSHIALLVPIDYHIKGVRFPFKTFIVGVSIGSKRCAL
jgi:hypothetical protein